jgi:hypothetical protein
MHESQIGPSFMEAAAKQIEDEFRLGTFSGVDDGVGLVNCWSSSSMFRENDWLLGNSMFKMAKKLINNLNFS